MCVEKIIFVFNIKFKLKHKTLNKQPILIVEQILKNAQTPLLHIHDVSSSTDY